MGKYQRSESKHRLLPRSDHRRHEIPEYLPSVAQKLYDEGKQAEAVAVLDKSLEEIPLYQVPADNSMLFYIPMYYELGETERRTTCSTNWQRTTIRC